MVYTFICNKIPFHYSVSTASQNIPKQQNSKTQKNTTCPSEWHSNEEIHGNGTYPITVLKGNESLTHKKNGKTADGKRFLIYLYEEQQPGSTGVGDYPTTIRVPGCPKAADGHL